MQKQLDKPGWWPNVRACFEADPELTTDMLRSESGAVRPPDWAVTPLAASEPPTDDRPTLAAAVGSAVRAVHAEVVRQPHDGGEGLREVFVDESDETAGVKPPIGSALLYRNWPDNRYGVIAADCRPPSTVTLTL